jgi:hypothetical protein
VRSLRRALRAFGAFWWDFLIGDTPDLFVATVVIVTLALVLRHHRQVALFALPATAIACLVLSTLRGTRRSPGAPQPSEGDS